MWIIIILIVVAIIAKFAYDKNEVNKKVEKQGGMKNKYRTLITHLLGNDPKSEIFKITHDTVVLGQRGPSGQTTITIMQAFKNVNITWKLESLIYGSHGLEWEFNEFKDQDEIAEIINHELGIYQENVMSK